MSETVNHDPLVDEVELLEANPQYAHVRLPNGKETTVSIKKLAPQGISTPSVVIDVQPTGLSEETNKIISKENYTSEINYSNHPSNQVSEPTLQDNIAEGMLQNDVSEHAFQNKITEPITKSSFHSYTKGSYTPRSMKFIYQIMI